MKNYLLNISLLLLVPTVSFAAEDFRTFNSSEMAEVSRQAAKVLSDCPNRFLKLSVDDIKNYTAQHIDRGAFAKIISDSLGVKITDSSDDRGFDKVSVTSYSRETLTDRNDEYVVRINFRPSRKACQAEVIINKRSMVSN